MARQALAIERHPLQIGPSGAPLAVPGGVLAPLGWTADGLILVCWPIIVGRQVARYRRSAGNRRQQLEWLIGLQDAVDLGTVRDELANAVHAAFGPAHLSIWIREL